MEVDDVAVVVVVVAAAAVAVVAALFRGGQGNVPVRFVEQVIRRRNCLEMGI